MAKTTKQVLREQEQQADRDRERKVKLPSVAKPALPATPDHRTPQQKYLDEISPSGVVGRLVKFNKEGKFVFADDDEAIAESEDFVVLADQTLISYVKFLDGEAPLRVGGLLYQGFLLPPREQLGDTNPTKWPIGLSGTPEDPWRHEMLVVLRRPLTLELMTFSTMSKTGRRAVGTLLKHYDRLQSGNPGAYPVVRLKPGGYQDRRYGWVAVPNFVVVGMANGHAPDVPDTSLKAALNDEIGF